MVEKKPSPELLNYHQAAEARVQTYRYSSPSTDDKPKQLTWLAKTDLLNVLVQTVRDGGENNLHYHVNADQCYFVLRGRVRFHGPDDSVYGEFGPQEGIVIPAGTRYWFEKVGVEDLDILQSLGRDRSKPENGRVNLDQHKDWMKENYLTNYDHKS
jgi:mannose-6-phosphate isomerase-like protein (cupin superfamily)